MPEKGGAVAIGTHPLLACLLGCGEAELGGRPSVISFDAPGAGRQVLWRMTVSGGAWLDVNSRRFHSTKGSLVCGFVPSRMKLVANRDLGVWRYLYVAFSGEAACRFAESIVERHGVCQNIPCAEKLESATRELVAQAASLASGDILAKSRLLYGWLHEWLSAAETSRASSKLDMRELQRLGDIEGASLTVKELARRMGYSRAYFARKLQPAWQCAPGRLLRRLRLERAATLLRTSTHPVAAIARDTGYATPGSFVRAFRSHYDLSPLVYRRTANESVPSPLPFGPLGR